MGRPNPIIVTAGAQSAALPSERRAAASSCVLPPG
jgi:hypothetical protein